MTSLKPNRIQKCNVNRTLETNRSYFANAARKKFRNQLITKRKVDNAVALKMAEKFDTKVRKSSIGDFSSYLLNDNGNMQIPLKTINVLASFPVTSICKLLFLNC